MTIDIMKLAKQGKSETLELKSTVDDQQIAETVCAFLNADGGQLLVGMDDAGNAVGIDEPDEEAERLDQFLRTNLSPAAAWAITDHELDDKPILFVDVPSGSLKPYVCKGKILFRRGSVDVAATANEVHDLITDRSKLDESWERQPAISHSLDELDTAEILRFMHDARDAGRLNVGLSQTLAVEEMLQRLGLDVDGHPIQAAVVAFGTNLLPWYPQCSLRLARFDGTTKDKGKLDRVTGHAFELFARASNFIHEHTPVVSTFTSDSMTRHDKPRYPVLAVREAIINAICHRDYSIAGGAVSVAIFDDRMEIVSTGTLPEGVSIEDVKGEHYSRPRNPLVADVFYRRGLIDLWGRGIHNVIRLCIDAGGKEPDFEERAGEFVVRFFSPEFASPELARFDLSDRQLKIISCLSSGAKRMFNAVKDEVDPAIADSTLRNDLVALRELGLVESGGFGRGAYWRLAKVLPE